MMNEQTTQIRRDKKQQIYKDFIKFFPTWKQTKIEDIKVERMAGITNEIYKVSRNGQQAAYIYRQFGDACDNIFLDRKAEEFVYQFISDCKAGPRIYGMTEDVRIEEFINSKVLKTRQMLTDPIIQDIAFALRRFHEISPPEQIPKISLFAHIFFKQDSKILQKCHTKMQKNIFTAQQKQIIKQLSKWVSKQQIQQLKKIAQPLQKSSLIFSHNDLLAGNILIRESDHKIIFIDYQYSCYNYQVYDIANYFNQCVIDYEVKQPPFYRISQPNQQQKLMKDKFIRCYAMAQQKKYKKYKTDVGNINQYQMTQSMKNVEKLMKQQLVVGQMLSHLMWGYWAIIVSKNPQIDFDYIAFAKYRYQQYSIFKQQLLKSNLKQ